jgi:hypothetical protein
MRLPQTGLANWAIGAAALAASVPLAWLLSRFESSFPDPERRVMATAVIFLLLLVAPPAAYLLKRRRAAEPRQAALLLLVAATVLMCGAWLYSTLPAILFPADILIWSESDFVNDIIKFRVGYPLYTDERNNESFIYPPAAQLATYALAWLARRPTSIPAYRIIQVCFVLAAVGLAAACCRRLARISGVAHHPPGLWPALSLPVLFLAATNPLTNPFTHNLHNDALALLVCAASCYVLLSYVASRGRGWLWAMIFLPGLGFAVKQSLLVWLPLFVLYLVVFDQPRSWTRVLAVLVAGSGFAAALIAGGYLLWGEPFRYWVLTVLGERGASPLRGFRHLLAISPYVGAGLVGAWALLRGAALPALLGPWLIWLLLTLVEIYTSGIAWMMNHIGPGSLLALVWFLVALQRLWPGLLPGTPKRSTWLGWFRAALVTVGLLLLFGGMGFIRVPLPAIPRQAYDYVAQIERRFQTAPARSVLLDVGSWVYLPQGVVMRDRAPCMGDRGYSQTGDFSGILERIERRHYAKILIRRLHSPDFWYDHFLWHKPSGIRRKLLEHYEEVERIPAGWQTQPTETPPYLFDEISVLAPKPRSVPPGYDRR